MPYTGCLLTLQWTALFAARMLAALGPGAQLAVGAALAAGWLASARFNHGLLRWSLRLVAGALVATLFAAYLASPLTGDSTLTSQLRAAIVDSALLLLGGAGVTSAAGLLRLQRVSRVF